ncbi:unnamed protein product [Durusdinium trenchii]|uniref:Selenoprotein O n=1 Tax=Durusdinium trenchii TaxID=1381693 RepID=A0ABP0IPJ2_9DINO
MVMDLEHPRAKAVKAAALVGLQRFSEAREVLDEINWKDLLVAAETYLDRTEFLQRCKVLERQSETSESMADGHGDDGDRSLDRFRFSDVFGSMLQAREKKRDPAMPMTPTAALLPPVPEAAANVEVRSSSSGRGLFATGPTKAGDVILCGLPLARCLNASGEPLVPALRQAAELSPHVRRVLSLLSDGTNDTKAVSLKDFSWRHDISPLRTETGMMPMSEEQLAQVVRINSFDLFGSSALFGARTMLKAMEVTDPASFTHTKLSFLDWLATKSLKGPQDSETLQAMRYCDWVHQARYGKVPGKELVPLLKCTQQATESTGVGEEFCNPWMKVARPALSSPSSASSAAVPSESAKSATMLLD